MDAVASHWENYVHTNQLTRRVAIFVAMITLTLATFATFAGDVSAQTPTATATATATATGTATATAPAGGTATATASPSGTTAPSPAKTGNAGLAGESTGGWLVIGLLTATVALAGTGWVAMGKRR